MACNYFVSMQDMLVTKTSMWKYDPIDRKNQNEWNL